MNKRKEQNKRAAVPRKFVIWRESCRMRGLGDRARCGNLLQGVNPLPIFIESVHQMHGCDGWVATVEEGGVGEW